MKKYMIIAAILMSGSIFAQNIVPPQLDAAGEKVRVTYYYENGKIQQEGFYKDGKLNGTWVSYDENGNKNAIGEYTNGVKTGRWFFWNGDNLSEVNYSKSKIESIKNWKQDAIVNRN